MNVALGAKLVWQLANDNEQLWMRILKEKYLDTTENLRILTIQNLIRGSTIWNFILSCKLILRNYLKYSNDNMYFDNTYNKLQ